ncbi:MAG: polysaccharide deacetylase family protein [Burkholderiales bacterium]|jgi:peptidoglycan/xylan/chitin deacetylase (PgdA/CDA1 family)|nr:polysaccharide deacetylase family protein [Burkholderiales bacterium]
MKWLKKILTRKKHGNSLDRKIAIPVFCYHSVNITGTAYDQNDHVALEEDLRTLWRLGFRLLSPVKLARVLRGEENLPRHERYASITFDDGSDLDYFDYDHPDAGMVKSLQHILEETPLSRDVAQQEALTASFVIVSPEARKELTVTCFLGQDLIRDNWWYECSQKRLIGIANHSWDHAHETLMRVCQKDNIKGSFYDITTYEDADRQIRIAQDYLDKMTKDASMRVFAYPYGHASSYLVEEYFPVFQKEHRQLAAYGLDPTPVTKEANIWNLPRYVCGKHWKAREEFEDILKDCVKS